MIEKLSERFTRKLINAELISEEDAEIYSYGFFQFCMMLLNIVTTLFLSIIFQLFVPCIILNMVFIPLRMNAGGHHADSPLKCYINSTIMISSLLAIIKWIPVSLVISVIMVSVSCIVNIIFAPVETENNPLDEIEKSVYRKRTMFILIIEMIAFLISVFVFNNWVSETIALGMFTESLLIILGITKGHK